VVRFDEEADRLFAFVHLNPRARGRTRPLGRPRPDDALRPLDWAPPRDEAAAGTRDCRGSVVANFFGVGLEAVGGFSTNDVSVVLSR
jgi:hypothetical protein